MCINIIVVIIILLSIYPMSGTMLQAFCTLSHLVYYNSMSDVLLLSPLYRHGNWSPPQKNQNSEKNHLQFYSPNLTDILMHVFPIILEGGFEFKILGLLGGLCWKMVAWGDKPWSLAWGHPPLSPSLAFSCMHLCEPPSLLCTPPTLSPAEG